MLLKGYIAWAYVKVSKRLCMFLGYNFIFFQHTLFQEPLPLSTAKELDARLSLGHDLRAALAELTGLVGAAITPQNGAKVKKGTVVFKVVY